MPVNALHSKPTCLEVENIFLEYFRRQDYHIVPGSSLVDESIKMAFVMSAGWTQVERAARLAGNPPSGRFVLVQNCFRHFDLERIGRDDIHLSLFRMAGAFTYGPLERSQRIAQVWALLTRVYGLPPEKLWITYFKGDTIAGHSFAEDVETRQAWLESGVHSERLIPLAGRNNFWKQSAQMMGADAPKCGPNTEVFYDRGAHRNCGAGCLPGCDCGRFVEFANTLFITWQLDEVTSELWPLVESFTETVIGVERLAMLLQGRDSVFEIDVLRPLVHLIRQEQKCTLRQAPALSGRERRRQQYRLVDHLRALLFLAADGAPPPWTKNARAYLMRRLVRGALTSMKLLEIPAQSFIPEMLCKIAEAHAQQRPGLQSAQATLMKYINDESEKFEQTLQKASHRLEHILMSAHTPGWLRGEEIIELEKLYGMPLDLLNPLLRAKHVRYSRKAYRFARERWRAEIAKAQGI